MAEGEDPTVEHDLRLALVRSLGLSAVAAGYARVSTDEQRTSGASLEAQRQAIEDECARRGWELLRVESDTLSGKTTRRPGLQAALDACRSGEVSGVVVAKLDRLTRSIVDFGRLLDEALDKPARFQHRCARSSTRTTAPANAPTPDRTVPNNLRSHHGASTRWPHPSTVARDG
jgi:hypothetical protein